MKCQCTTVIRSPVFKCLSWALKRSINYTEQLAPTMSVYQQGLRLFRLSSTRLICLAISILCRRCPPHVNVNTNGKPFSHEITVNKWQDYTVSSLHTLLAHETTPAIGCTQLFLTITYANLSCLLVTLFWASQSHLSYNLSPWTPLRCAEYIYM